MAQVQGETPQPEVIQYKCSTVILLTRSFLSQGCHAKHDHPITMQINLETGGCVEKNLEGQLCSSAPKQRVYEVVDDKEYLW